MNGSAGKSTSSSGGRGVGPVAKQREVGIGAEVVGGAIAGGDGPAQCGYGPVGVTGRSRPGGRRRGPAAIEASRE